MARKDEDRDGGVLAGLPRSRPQRRSGRRKAAAEASPAATAGEPRRAKAAASKRSASAGAKASKPSAAQRPKATGAAAPKRRPAAAPAKRLRQPAQPRNVPPQPARSAPAQSREESAHAHLVGTAVQAAGELAQISVTVGAHVLRGALSKLPRP